MRSNTWRILTSAERASAIIKMQSMPIETQEQRRDMAILKRFVIDGMSASAISRMNDPAIVCYSNRAKGKQLSPSSILERIYEHFPEFKKQKQDRSGDARTELMRKRQKTKNPHKQACAFCGTRKNLEEHHMIPLMMGGTNDDCNLIYLCHKCHLQVTQYQMELRQKSDNLLRGGNKCNG